MRVMVEPAEEWIRFGELLAILGVCDREGRRIVAEGTLSRRQVGRGRPRLLKSEVEALVERSTRRAAGPDPSPNRVA